MTAHVLWSRMDVKMRRVMHCPTCQCRRRFFGWAQEWYSAIWTCCHCGDSWSDGERMGRPFARGWRQEAAARAKRNWTESL